MDNHDRGQEWFGVVSRREVRIDKSWERLFDDDLGLSIDDGKKIIAALQSAVVNQEAETYASFGESLSGLPHLPAGQGLYDAPDPNWLRHGEGSQSRLA